MLWLTTLLYLVTINCAEFLLFKHDKNCARLGVRRVPEATLLRLAFIGGSIGAFAGRSMYRHKTRKQPFVTWLYLIAMIQAGVLVGLFAAYCLPALPR